ncbi:MAG: response regulator transcription factor [Proteobacteria bacterium]|nr:response regulator transcription factor [Pseudomonadota bacterium]
MTSAFPETNFVPSTQVGRYNFPDFDQDLPALQVRDDTVRVFRFADCRATELDGWISAAFPLAGRRFISETYIANFMDGEEPYAVAIVAANDLERARKFLRYNKPLLSAKLKIALLASSRPPQRATLLMAGFDDVFDTRTNIAEAQLRIAAMSRRNAIYGQASRRRGLGGGAATLKAAFASPLTPRELQVASLLAAHMSTGLPRSAILSEFGIESQPLSHAALKVVISKLRAKLAPGWIILSNRGYAYRLQPDDVADLQVTARRLHPTLR